MPGEKYEYGIDFDRIAAIDIHTHVEVDGHGHKAYDDELVDAVGKYFKMGPGALSSVDALADEYRRHNTAAVVFTIDARTGMRHVPNSVEDLIAGAMRNNDVLIPFGSVDPWHERRAVHRVHELVRDYGVKGFKFHPSMQAFEPNDRRFYPIYEAIAEAGVPALFHTGPDGHRRRAAGRAPHQAALLRPDAARRRGRRLPGADDRDGPSGGAVGGRPDRHRLTQEQRLHRPVRAGRRSTSRRNWCTPPAVSCGRRCCSAPTTRTSRWTAGAATSRALDIDPAVVPLIYKDNALRVLGVTS